MHKKNFFVKKINKLDLMSLKVVCDILYLSGKNMADKYGLHHWDNSFLKTLIIVFLCNLQNDIYVVKDGSKIVATFQIKRQEDSLIFRKLATIPDELGKGIGSFCMMTIEKIAREEKCIWTKCEVYDKSTHAIEFYENRGYQVYDTVATLKYTEIKMKKQV